MAISFRGGGAPMLRARPAWREGAGCRGGAEYPGTPASAVPRPGLASGAPSGENRRVNEGIRRALLRAEPGAEAFLRFEAPVESRQAHRPEQVPALLAWAEEGAAAGDWMVGFVGYEAAPAFDAALVAHPPAAGPAPLDAHSPVVGDVPALILSGGLDPVTPPSRGDEVAKSLTHSRHVVAPGYGHIVSPHACGPRLLAAFVEDAGFARLPVDCVRQFESSVPPALWTGVLGPAPR
ncbi:MAG: hypothetical protein F9K18_14555 [Thermoanaerobaculia bacterium]|nr:MAG: hypothetical protein F9K18_14555 [Thermoanaerobaculia bacterium]